MSRSARIGRALGFLLLAGGIALLGRAAPESGLDQDDLDAWFETGQQLFDQYAPPALKESVRFPTRGEWDAFWRRLETTLHSDSLADWAWIRPEAERALDLLRTVPGGEDYADWLVERLDYLEMAEGALQYVLGQEAPVRAGPVAPDLEPSQPPPAISRSASTEAVRTARNIENWKRRIGTRAPPANAATLVPRLKPIFAGEGVPAEWVWLAEVESSFNPKAKSPVGARGLFQFMPATAERFGLKTSWPDQRTDPEQSARAAARYLRILYGQLGSWPLAVAAYNAGEGRVGRLLGTHGASTYDGIVDYLPTETQLYVPKVFATVAVREGVDPLRLPPPRPR